MKKFSLILFLGFSIFNIQAQQCSLLEIGPDETLTCTNNCTTLTANFMGGFWEPSDVYTISNQTPCPLPPVTGGTPTSIDTDDEWSKLIPLPFDFVFFGNTFNEIIIGDNGVVSFDTNRTSPQIQKPEDRCEWRFSDPLPSPNLFRNTIFGAYHDLYIPAGGTIEYYESGTEPQRIFVISFNNVAHYDCHNKHTTQRILLYETTNVIDVQIIHKDLCSWNNGNAVVGIQNEDGTVAYVPPGRNTGRWRVNNEELWRFSPNDTGSGVLPHTTTWYNATTNTVIGTGDSIYFCITEDVEIRCEVEYTDFTNTQYTLTDTKTLFFDDSHDDVDLGPDQVICENSTTTLDATTPNATAYQWQLNGVDIPGATNPTYDASQAGNYSVLVDIGICSTTDDVNISTLPAPSIDINPDFHFCEGSTETITTTITNQTGNLTYQWYKDGVEIPGANSPDLDIDETGTYQVDVTNSTGCVGYAEVVATMDEYPYLELGSDQTVCFGDIASIQSNITDADTYEWIVNGNVSGNTTDVLNLNASGDYEVVLNLNRGACSVTDTIHVTVLNPINVTATPILYGELSVEADGGLPPYEYSVDGINYQKSDYFIDLPDGDYQISIKDGNGCEYNDVLSVHVINLIIMQFFTPNGDGFNDYWRIKNAENTPQSNLYIYDRYGKLVKHMNTNLNDIWDGTFNGTPLVANDYWYMLVLPSGKVYKGHFALKR